ncbi:MAG TPA: hypothetical protein VI603_08680 [Saprospiraceae bacterium]|nr:hypothetical protein [Saprospiraceae bacterium]
MHQRWFEHNTPGGLANIVVSKNDIPVSPASPVLPASPFLVSGIIVVKK